MAEQIWRDLDNDEFERRDQIAQSRRTPGDFIGYWTPKVGSAAAYQRNVLRILPPHHDMPGDPFVTVKMHFLPSNEISQKTGKPIAIGINCLKPFGKTCPACDMAQRLLNEADGEADVEAAKKHAKGLTAKDRVFIQMIDIDDQAKGPQRYAFGPEVEKKLRQAFRDDDGNRRNITHPRTGRDVIMRVGKRAGTDFNDYDVRAKEQSSPLAEMKWLEQLTDLTELQREPAIEHVLMACRGERPQPTQTATSAPTKTAPAPKSEAKPEPKAKAETKPAKAAKAEPEAEAEAEPVVREKKPKRTAAPAATEDNGHDPYARARAEWETAKQDKPFLDDETTPFARIIPMTPERLPAFLAKTHPQCFQKETDVTDDTCRTCALMLPCLEAVIEARG